MSKRHRILVAVLFIILGIFAVVTSPAKANERPNVILILADDLGYECIGANGGTSYKTPHLDKLAASGVRFTNCYVQPLCTPTRVQLMTGQYNVRNYVEFGLLDREQTTFAQLFRRAGYATCIAGKWQLGRDSSLPRHFGFDEHCLWQLTRRPGRYKNPGLEINGKEFDYSAGEYGPDLVNAYALDFISRNKAKPFLLYYPMMLTHDPYDPTPDSVDWKEGAAAATKNADNAEGGVRQRRFADMVAYMDKLIGKVVARLDELSLREKTLILFVGDNGTGRGTRSRMGDRTVVGGKGLTVDTGMHVPLIASGAACAKGRVCADLVDSTDFLPTICQAAGVKTPANLTLDGQSFLAQLQGEKGTPRNWIYSWYSRDGSDKAAREFARNRSFKLYRDGAFYDVSRGDADENPLDVKQLSGDAAKAFKDLSAVLAKYEHARPAKLTRK